jgi:hypothetical protein
MVIINWVDVEKTFLLDASKPHISLLQTYGRDDPQVIFSNLIICT